MNNDEYDAYIDGVSSLNDQNISIMQATLNSSRAEHEIYGGFSQYNQDVVDYSVAESTSEEYFQKINDLLSERADEIAHAEKVDEIIHWTVFAATIAGSIVATIATGGAAAGSTAAIIGSVVQYTCMLGGLANSVSWSCTNFDQNTVILSQCVNQGTLKAEQDCNLGGFVGVMHEYGIISESLNLGSIEATENSSYGQATTTAKGKCEIEDCILAGGKSWNGYDVDKKKIGADMVNIYYWTEGEVSSNTSDYSTNINTKEDLGNPNTYQGLSLGDNGNHWIMSQYGDLTLPVPYRCRFME
jgi:ABC-type multidrug transport system fused ATPase/permease subunit